MVVHFLWDHLLRHYGQCIYREIESIKFINVINATIEAEINQPFSLFRLQLKYSAASMKYDADHITDI
jgi:hypothetical protein